MKLTRFLAVCAAACLLCLAESSFAQVCCCYYSPSVDSRERAEVLAHTARLNWELERCTQAACAAAQREAGKWARQTSVALPCKDAYGDPMYTHFGPRAYADSPMYSGPTYTASFDRVAAARIPDSTYRGLFRGVYSHPQISARTDVSLQPGATHSYMQSGMLVAPGMMAPSGTRAIINNSVY